MTSSRVEPWLLEVLACPRCRSPLVEGQADGQGTLTCTASADPGCGLVYPVRDGIPVLLVDEASRPSGGA